MAKESRRAAVVALGRLARVAPASARNDLEIVGARLGTSVARAERAAAGYTTTETRERLGVSLPTVHAWIRGGLLPTIATKDAGEEMLTVRGAVDELAEGLEQIRRSGPRKHLLRDVAAWLETRRLVEANPELRRRVRRGSGDRVRWRRAIARAWGRHTTAHR